MAWAIAVDDDVTTDSFASIATGGGGTTIIPACTHPTKILSVWVCNKHATLESTLILARTQSSTGVSTRLGGATYGVLSQGTLLENAMIELERGDAVTATAGTATAIDINVSYHRNSPKPTAPPAMAAAPAPAPAATSSKPAVWGKA
jgi:hypothetical protein